MPRENSVPQPEYIRSPQRYATEPRFAGAAWWWWCACAGGLAAGTLAANAAVLAGRGVPVALASLAAADLLLAAAVLPLAVARELFAFHLDHRICAAWAALDVCCCTASILSLAALGWERLAAVRRPLQAARRARTARRLVAALWPAAAAAAAPAAWVHSPAAEGGKACSVNINVGYVFFSITISFYIPAVIIIVVYWRVWRALHSLPALRRHHGRSPSPQRRVEMNQTDKSQESVHDLAESPMRDDMDKDKQTPLKLFLSPRGRHLISPRRAINMINSPTPQKTIWLFTDFISPVRVITPSKRREDMDLESGKAPKITTPLKNAGTSLLSEEMRRRQARATRIIFVVVFGFLFCWTPFFVLLPIEALCECVEPYLFTISIWLGYANSAINPLIYAVSSPLVRNHLSKTLRSITFFSQESSQRSSSTHNCTPI